MNCSHCGRPLDPRQVAAFDMTGAEAMARHIACGDAPKLPVFVSELDALRLRYNTLQDRCDTLTAENERLSEALASALHEQAVMGRMLDEVLVMDSAEVSGSRLLASMLVGPLTPQILEQAQVLAGRILAE